MQVISAGLLGGSAGNGIIAARDLPGFFDQVRQWYGHDASRFSGTAVDPATLNLKLQQPTHAASFSVHVGAAEEPVILEVAAVDWSGYFSGTATRDNRVRITGPEGAGGDRFVSINARLPYTIRFENAADAKDIIKTVRIVQQLDSDLDLRTFHLGEIRLGDVSIHIPDGRGAFNGDFDFVDELGIVLRVTAGVDVMTGVATWELTALDPLTGLPAGDANLGLLKPNANRTQFGSVSYTIKAKPETATGTRLESSARVFYDSQAPIEPMPVQNTVDAAAPLTSFQVRSLNGGSYQLNWSAQDNAGGSGVKSYAVFVSVNDDPYAAWLSATSEVSAIYPGKAGQTAMFVVLATDAAGNLEMAPAGVALPAFDPSVNLGTPPTAPEVVEPLIPPVATPEVPATHALFLQALLRVPSANSLIHPASFSLVFEPFLASAFAWSMDQSGAGIGALSMAFSPDGQSVYVSGGKGRNQLFRFTLAGGAASTPLATLDVPIYDLVFDPSGQLWATTGGGPLVQIDPDSGRIVNRYRDGVTLGLAADAKSGNLYVSTGNGVDIFDPRTQSWKSFSSLRVQSLAFSPSGELWATTWPKNGQVVRFNRLGQAEVIYTPELPATGLAFGPAGTQLSGLLFLSHASGGKVTMMDLASRQTMTIAQGGGRGQFVHLGPDGRVYLAQSQGVEVLSPMMAPRITQAPGQGSVLDPLLTSLALTFDADMQHGSAVDLNSVTNPANYRLVDLDTGRRIELGAVTYSAVTRTARLWFEALLPSSYQLTVSTSVFNELGVPMSAEFQTTFDVLADVTDQVAAPLNYSRADRQTHTIYLEAAVKNTLGYSMLGPVRLVFPGLNGTQASLLNADGFDRDGNPYLNLLYSDQAALAAGASTPTRTLIIANPDWESLNLIPRVVCGLPPNQPPQITSDPFGDATAGQPYTYDVEALDPDGATVSYVLVAGPSGAAINPNTGLISWTPARGASRVTLFEVRAFDARGDYDSQRWTVVVANVNRPPALRPVGNYQIREGDLLQVPVEGFDPDNDVLSFWIDHLPGGAVFDAQAGVLRWQTDFESAGRYGNVTLGVSDGLTETSQTLEILVTDVNQAPRFEPPPAQTIRENDQLSLLLKATDVDGDRVAFSAPVLPAGAVLNPDTGLFWWTPDYTQHGSYQIQFLAGDGQQQTARTLNIEVLNVNGPVRFDQLGHWVVYEGQSWIVNVGVQDPDHPASATLDEAIENGQAPPTLLWSTTALPPGATFEATTHRLAWTPTFSQAGQYTVTFTVTDDGDGTGTSTTATETLNLEVRDTNGAPVVASVDNQTVEVGQSIDINLAAADPEGRPLRLTVTGLPKFATFIDHGNGTGVIHATPALTERGDTMITVLAADDGNGDPKNVLTGQTSFILTAHAANAPPVMDFVGDKVALIGQELFFQVRVSDLDEDPLTFGATGLPAGATFAGFNTYGVAEFRWTPTAGDVGTITLTLKVTDDGNGNAAPALSDSKTLKLVVRAANAAPVLSPIGAKQTAENQLLGFTLQAQDSDQDGLTFGVTGLPGGATFDPATGAFAWKPNYFQAGTYQVQFSVSDGQRGASENVTLTVSHVNRAPQLAPLPPQVTLEGQLLQFSIAGGDLDGDALTYFIEGSLPAGASFEARTQNVTWTPGYDQAGRYTVRFTVADPAGLTSSMDAVVEVLNVNRAPELPRLSGHGVLMGDRFRLLVPGQRSGCRHDFDLLGEELAGRRHPGCDHGRVALDSGGGSGGSASNHADRFGWAVDRFGELDARRFLSADRTRGSPRIDPQLLGDSRPVGSDSCDRLRGRRHRDLEPGN